VPKLLSRSSVAKRLDISPKTLMRWVEEGSFPPPTHKVPGNSPERWFKYVVDAWETAHAVAVPQNPVKGRNDRPNRDKPGQIPAPDGS